MKRNALDIIRGFAVVLVACLHGIGNGSLDGKPHIRCERLSAYRAVAAVGVRVPLFLMLSDICRIANAHGEILRKLPAHLSSLCSSASSR